MHQKKTKKQKKKSKKKKKAKKKMFIELAENKKEFNIDLIYRRARQTGTLSINNKSSFKEIPKEIFTINDYKWEDKECKWWELCKKKKRNNNKKKYSK